MDPKNNLIEQSLFYDEYWKDLKPFGNYKIKRIAHILGYLELARKSLGKLNILDLGCGDGRCAAIWNEIGQTTGLDLSVKAMEIANKRYPFIKYSSGDATATQFEENAFNTIITQEVIEHIVDQEKFINECHRLLDTKGFLILTTPNKKYFDATLEGNYSRQPIENIIDTKTLEVLLKDKFKIIKLETIIYAKIDKGFFSLLFRWPFQSIITKLSLKSVQRYLISRSDLGLQICLLAQKID